MLSRSEDKKLLQASESDHALKPRRVIKEGTSHALPISTDSHGEVVYDAIAQQGHEYKHLVQFRHDQALPLVQQRKGPLNLEKPTLEVANDTAQRTQQALQTLVSSKLSASQPKNLNLRSNSEPQYFKYVPGNQVFNGNNEERIIKMVNKQQDPMDPPKFRNRKVPKGTGSPPPPILHSPPRKVTAKEQQDWKIPPSISSWKNPKGYTIPLDKRLASDGRANQKTTINNRFADFSEALFNAEKQAREDVKIRSQVQKKLAEQELEQKEERLRQLAHEARNRASYNNNAHSNHDLNRTRRRSPSPETEGERAEYEERERLRRERRREAERQLRMSRMGYEKRLQALSREEGRDISEKIALGTAKPAVSKESMFDARLYNRDNLQDSSAYTIYDKPWNTNTADHIYRLSGGIKNSSFNYDKDEAAEIELNRIHQDQRFDDLNKGKGPQKSHTGPIVFEKDDPYGTEAFFHKLDDEPKQMYK